MTGPAEGWLEGQVSLVTGGAQGTGREIVLELSRLGMAVALADRSVDQLDEVAAQVEAAGGQALVVPAHVTDRASVESLVARVEGGLGPIDLLVNAADDAGPLDEFLSTHPDTWWRTVELQLRGAALCSYYVLKRMTPRRRGRIVNVTSDAAFGPAPVGSEAACSSAALTRLTDSLALAGWEHGISVFAVGPGLPAGAADEDAEGAAVSSQRAGRLVAELASGRADRLSGRFVHVEDDLAELLSRADEVRAADLYQLRLKRLQPSPAEEPTATLGS